MATNIQLQPRDTRCLTDVGEVGLLDTPTIHARHWPQDATGRACQRRLKMYAEASLTCRLGLSYAPGTGRGGRLHAIYGLTPRGSQVLRELAGVELPRFWRSPASPERIQHYLGVAKMRLAFTDACILRGLPKPRWIMENDLRPGCKYTDPRPSKYILWEVFDGEDGAKITCRPDASSLLLVPGNGPGKGPAWHPLITYWEYDRSTESLGQVAAKLDGFQALLTSETFRQHWPGHAHPTVRVFFLCQTQERLNNISKTIRDLPGAEHVRLAALPDFDPHRIVTDRIWHTVTGEKRAIMAT